MSAQEDTDLRLNQSIERNTSQQERELLEGERTSQADLPTLIVDGQEYDVTGDVNAMGRALYTAVTQQQWSAAATLLEAYRNLDRADPMLVHFAQGALNRARDDLAEAELQYRELLNLKADFLLGQLELARVLFENHKNREANRLFERVLASLDPEPEPERTAGVRNTVNTYLRALENRLSWHARASFGPAYDDNLNRSSGSYTCLIPDVDGSCFFSRKVPDAVSAYGAEFEGTFEKEFPVKGHHGAFVRAVAYGDTYRDYHEFNQGTYVVSTGYRHRNAQTLYSFAPLFEQGTFGNDTLYEAWGARSEWMHQFSPRTALRLEGDHKDLRYRDERYAHQDGALTSLYVTTWHELPGQWTLFAGLDRVDRDSAESARAYRQDGMRLGFLKQLASGMQVNLFTSFRRRENDAFSQLLDARRRDDINNYFLTLKFPQLAFHDVVPTIAIEHTRVTSNIDWLYSYRRSAVSLRFEWRL